MGGFASDHRSGSGNVATAFLAELGRWSALDTSASPAALRVALLQRLRAAQTAHPSLALIHQLAARALDVADTAIARGEGTADVRAHLAASCAAESADLAAGLRETARHALTLCDQRDAWIVTLSHSGTVREAFLEAHRAGLRPRALIGEGRPLMEGRALASALAEAGLPVWLVVDAALPLLLSQAHLAWIGADAITEQGVLNKVGSFAVALAAREHSVPLYALASRRKFMPAATAALRIEEMPATEVWDAPGTGVRPRNVYFELVPMNLVRGIVVEDGALGASEAATLARERPLPDELAAG